MSRTLEFKGSTERIGLPDLKRSVPYSDCNGKLPRSRPVEHHEVWSKIIELAQANGLKDVVAEDVTIHSGQSMRVSWPHRDQPVPVENLLIQRVHGVIRLGKDIVYDGETMCPAIGIIYMEDGIYIGFGMNVRICENLNIYGANVISTKEVEYPQVVELLETWMKNMEAKWDTLLRIYKRAKGISISKDERFRLYGKLISNAVDMNEGRQERSYLNVTQVVSFVRDINKKFSISTDVNLWDLMQAGTTMLKPDKANFATLLKVNQEFGNFLLSEYNIEEHEPEITKQQEDPVYNEVVNSEQEQQAD